MGFPLKVTTWIQIFFQDRASPSLEQIIFLHDTIITLLSIVTVLVRVRLIRVCCIKFTNQTLLQQQVIEIIWTLSPIFVLLLITLPSLQTLYLLDDPFLPAVRLKAIGHQWYWSYEYPDFPDINFRSYITPTDNTTPSAQFRLLDVDSPVVLPITTQIRIITTRTDVIHSWTIPSLGLKTDSIPGRLNLIITSINRSGILYGQCSEICGANHRFMPIKLEVVPIKNFLTWISNFSSTGVRSKG